MNVSCRDDRLPDGLALTAGVRVELKPEEREGSQQDREAVIIPMARGGVTSPEMVSVIPTTFASTAMAMFCCIFRWEPGREG
jgi:hypothetical protein